MERILLIAAEFEPFNSSGINRLSFFKKYLQQQGHFVAVLATKTAAQGINAEKDYDHENNIYRAFSLSLLARRLLSSKRLPIYPKLSRTGKYDVWVPFAVAKGKKLIKELDIDLVFSSFPDFASIQVAEKIASQTSTRLITDFRDPPYWIYDKQKTDTKTRYRQEIIKKAIKASDKVIVCTEGSKDSLVSYYNITNKIEIVCNGYDIDVIESLPQIPQRTDDYFEIVHIGSFYSEGRDIKPVVSALEKHTRNQDKKIKLRLIGDLPDSSTIAKINEVAKSFIVSIEPPIAMKQALAIAKQADVLLLLQGERFNRQIPAKVYEYLALNRPILAVVGINGATHQLLKKYDTNVVISDCSSDKCLEEEIGNLYKLEGKKIDCAELSRQRQVETMLDYIL